MKKLIFAILFVVALVDQNKAQNTLTGPHGGKFKSAGYCYVEVVECYQFLEFYMYEADMYPIHNRGFSGRVDFNYPDNTHSTSKLYPYGVEGFTAEVTRQCYTSCEVEIKNSGVSIKVIFSGFGENNEDCKRPDKDQAQN